MEGKQIYNFILSDAKLSVPMNMTESFKCFFADHVL